MNISEVISHNANIIGGVAVFTGTRVPIKSLFDYIESNQTINDFIDDFPTVKREQALMLLEISKQYLQDTTYEIAA